MSFWDSLWDRLVTFGETFIEWAILVLIALVVLVVGRWIIKLISKLVAGFLDAGMLEGMWKRSGVSKALAEGDQTPGTIMYTQSRRINPWKTSPYGQLLYFLNHFPQRLEFIE